MLNLKQVTYILNISTTNSYKVHALSSYKDHPYKDQVVHFRKNKDQY